MNSTRAHQQQNTFSKNVVKRGKGVIFSQVIEKAKKINGIIHFTDPEHLKPLFAAPNFPSPSGDF